MQRVLAAVTAVVLLGTPAAAFSLEGSGELIPQALGLASACAAAPRSLLACEEWVHAPNATVEEAVLDMAVSPHGDRVYATGYSSREGTNFHFACTHAWFGARYSEAPFASEILVKALDASTGQTVWATQIAPKHGDVGIPCDLAISPSGRRIFVVGTVGSGENDWNYVVLALKASTGRVMWRYDFDGPAGGADIANGLEVSPNGRQIYVTGTSEGAGSGEDFATLALDARNGRLLWQARYEGPGPNRDFNYGFDIGSVVDPIALGAHGSVVFVTGTSETPDGRYDIVTAAYGASTGAMLWESRYDGAFHNVDTAVSIQASPSGDRVYVGGSTLEEAGLIFPMDFVTLAYDAATGEQLWRADFSTPGVIDELTSMAVAPDGSRVFVHGFTGAIGSIGSAQVTVAYEASTGQTAWTARRLAPGAWADVASRIVVSPDGQRVFATGTSFIADWNFETVAYDAVLGLEAWAARYDTDNGAADLMSALAVSPDGHSVYVGGLAGGNGSGQTGDFTVVKYDAALPTPR